MVGTSAIAAFLTRKPSRARRKAGTVRTTMGLRDIWLHLFAVFFGTLLALRMGRGRLTKPADHIRQGQSRQGHGRQGNSRTAWRWLV
jgi:hypothetical protein